MAEDTPTSNYDRDEILAALAEAEEADSFAQRDRPRRSPEKARILQHHKDWIATKLTAEDRSHLDQIRGEHQAEGLRLAEADKASSVERSAGRLALLQSRVNALRAAAEDLPSASSHTLSSRSHDRITLDTASSITWIGQTALAGTVEAPWASRARMTDAWPSNLEGQHEAGVTFFFFWRNPSSHSVVLEVWTSLAYIGFCRVGADGAIFGSNDVYLRASTFLGCSIPPSPSQAGQQTIVAELLADEGGFLGLGEVETESVSGSDILTAHNFIVPGGAVAAFQSGMKFTAVGQGDCSATVNFAELIGRAHV